jgi:hypothetical protein
MTVCVSGRCGIIPPVMIISAQSRSASASSSVLRLTRRHSQVGGSSAATVINPSGGAGMPAPKTAQWADMSQNERP